MFELFEAWLIPPGNVLPKEVDVGGEKEYTVSPAVAEELFELYTGLAIRWPAEDLFLYLKACGKVESPEKIKGVSYKIYKNNLWIQGSKKASLDVLRYAHKVTLFALIGNTYRATLYQLEMKRRIKKYAKMGGEMIYSGGFFREMPYISLVAEPKAVDEEKAIDIVEHLAQITKDNGVIEEIFGTGAEIYHLILARGAEPVADYFFLLDRKSMKFALIESVREREYSTSLKDQILLFLGKKI